jgi:hypothetical protein
LDNPRRLCKAGRELAVSKRRTKFSRGHFFSANARNLPMRPSLLRNSAYGQWAQEQWGVVRPVWES